MPVANVPNARGWRLGCSCRVSANSNVEVAAIAFALCQQRAGVTWSLPLLNRVPRIGLTASVHSSSFEVLELPPDFFQFAGSG